MSQQGCKHDVRSRRRLRNGKQFAELTIRARPCDLGCLTVHFRHRRATNAELPRQRGERSGIVNAGLRGRRGGSN
jgi:hypothetical protein